MRLMAHNRRIALAQRRTLMASFVCAVWSAVAVVAWAMGKAPADAVMGLLAFNAAGVLLFNVVIRSGWTLRFADVGLTQAQMVFAVTSMCGIYVVLPQARAAAIQTMCLALVFSTFSLSEQACRRMGALLAVIPLLTVLALRAHAGPAFSMAHDGVPAIGAACIILVMSRLLSLFCGMRMHLNQQRDELKRLADDMSKLAMTDELTGLLNRRCMTEKAQAALARHGRSATPLCVAMLDIDHFKRVNDVYGHHIGDEVLAGVAQALRDGLRTTDLLARWGGEEFLVLLPDADAASAKAVLDRVLAAMQCRAATPSQPALRVSFTAGVAQWGGEEPLEVLVRRADEALYEGKGQGRCRVLVAA